MQIIAACPVIVLSQGAKFPNYIYYNGGFFMIKTINLNGSEMEFTELGGDNTEIINNSNGIVMLLNHRQLRLAVTML